MAAWAEPTPPSISQYTRQRGLSALSLKGGLDNPSVTVYDVNAEQVFGDGLGAIRPRYNESARGPCRGGEHD